MNDIVIAHHGVKGMKWGVRRYQNKDGSLTAAGKNRYGEAYEGFAKNYRTKQVQRVGKSYDKQISRVNRRLAKKVDRTERKLVNAKESGASDKKVQKLERKNETARLRADFVANRNKQIRDTKIAYAKKTFGKRLIDPDTWFDTSATRAHQKAADAMAKKYGQEKVDSLVLSDTAKVVVATTIAAVGSVAISDLMMRRA